MKRTIRFASIRRVVASDVGELDETPPLRIGHLSNAGLGRGNPGTETLSFVVSAPFGRLIASSRNP